MTYFCLSKYRKWPNLVRHFVWGEGIVSSNLTFLREGVYEYTKSVKRIKLGRIGRNIRQSYPCFRLFKKKSGLPQKGQYTSILNSYKEKYDLEWYNPHIKTKVCPVCNTKFTTGGRKGKSHKAVTCSYSCSNTYFRSGSNNPNFNGSNYRIKCFEKWGKKCCICDEDKIVAVHHIDENHENNDVQNLAPMCPTHHQYIHSKYKYLIIENKFNEYLMKR